MIDHISLGVSDLERAAHFYEAALSALGLSRLVTRVLIESEDEAGESWTTVGVSPNIIDASFQALMDSVIYKLVKSGAPA